MVDKAFDMDTLRAERVRNRNHKVLPVCFLCCRVPPEGLKNGFFLRGLFICSECEQKLINRKPEEKEEYMLTIAKLRNVLFTDKPR